MAQMKEQNKTPEKELNETEITNLTDAEFKTLIIRILKELIEYGKSIKKTQEEMKVTLSHRWQTQGLRAESGSPPCFIQPSTLFLPISSTEHLAPS